MPTDSPSNEANMVLYKPERIGLFIGYLTAPFDDLFNFQKETILDLFQLYKEKLDTNINYKSNCDTEDAFSKTLFYENTNPSTCIHEFKELLYIPETFCLLGKFSLAVISLVDDFEFGIRTFQSGSNFDKKKNYNFEYQIVHGINPYLIGLYKKEDKAAEYWKKAILENVNKPLIALCSLKINNALLIGNGANITKHLLVTIHNFTNALDEVKHGKVSIWEIETFSWNEFTIVMLSDSFYSVSSVVKAIQGLTVNELLKHNSSEDLLLSKNGLKSSILYQNYHCPFTNKEQGLNGHNQDFIRAHLFTKTTTKIGFRFKILDSIKVEIDNNQYNPLGTNEAETCFLHIKKVFCAFRVTKDDKVHIKQNWHLKSGHFKEFIQEFNKVKKVFGTELNINEQVVLGDPDIAVDFSGSSYDVLCALTLLELCFAKKMSFITNQCTSLCGIGINNDEDVDKMDDKPYKFNHFFHKNNLTLLKFDSYQLDKLSNNLIKMGISKSLCKDIENLYAHFNDQITDSVMYIYYLELKEGLNDLLYNIQKDSINIDTTVYPIEHISEDYSKRCDAFKKAFHNRLHQSHQLENQSDFNFEFKGGLHQLISIYDGAYKSISSSFGNPNNIAYFTSFPGFFSTNYSVKFNYFHLIQPEVFFGIATHEAAQYFNNGNLEKSFVDKCSGFFSETKNVLYFLYKNDSLEYNQIIFEQLDIILTEGGRYLIVDSLNLTHSFFGDFEKFLFWKWMYFFQMPESYRKPNQIRESKLIAQLSRLLFLESIFFNPEKNKNRIDDFESYKHLININASFSNLIDNYSFFLNIILKHIIETGNSVLMHTNNPSGIPNSFLFSFEDIRNTLLEAQKKHLDKSLKNLIGYLNTTIDRVRKNGVFFDKKSIDKDDINLQNLYSALKEVIEKYNFSLNDGSSIDLSQHKSELTKNEINFICLFRTLNLKIHGRSVNSSKELIEIGLNEIINFLEQNENTKTHCKFGLIADLIAILFSHGFDLDIEDCLEDPYESNFQATLIHLLGFSLLSFYTNKNYSSLLVRSAIDLSINLDATKDAAFHFDNRGGIFVNHPNIRRIIFRYRTLLLKKIEQIGNFNKKIHFKYYSKTNKEKYFERSINDDNLIITPLNIFSIFISYSEINTKKELNSIIKELKGISNKVKKTKIGFKFHYYINNKNYKQISGYIYEAISRTHFKILIIDKEYFKREYCLMEFLYSIFKNPNSVYLTSEVNINSSFMIFTDQNSFNIFISEFIKDYPSFINNNYKNNQYYKKFLSYSISIKLSENKFKDKVHHVILNEDNMNEAANSFFRKFINSSPDILEI